MPALSPSSEMFFYSLVQSYHQQKVQDDKTLNQMDFISFMSLVIEFVLNYIGLFMHKYCVFVCQ